MKAFIAVLCILLVCCVSFVSAKTFYVAGAGNDSWSGLSPDKNDTDGPWKTINKANSAVQAGDTVYIREGKYSNDMIKPANSGTSESYRIVYKKYKDETVTIIDAAYGIQLESKSYLTINGIHFYNLDRFVIIDGGGHNIVEYCTFDSMRNYVTWSGSHIQGSSQYNRIHHCTFSRWGIFDTLARGAMFDLGAEGLDSDVSDYNLIEDCEFHSGGHHLFAVFSKYNVIRNNYFENDEWYKGSGYRCIITDGMDAGMNVLEGNRIAWAGKKDPQASGASGLDLRHANFIIRFNCFYKNAGSGITVATVNEPPFTEPHHNYIYNNVFYGNGTDTSDNSIAAISFRAWNGMASSIRRNVIKNNIMYKNPRTYTAWEGTSLDSQIIVNNWEESGNPQFVDTSSSGAQTADKPDFHLSVASPCIDKGVFLTTITSASGSGTSFQVDDARYFTDGFKVVEGDLVQLEHNPERVRIINIDYTNNTLTVDKSITWTSGQKIGLVYSGASPDLGAHEYPATKIIYEHDNFIVKQKNTLSVSGSVIRYIINAPCSVTLDIYTISGKRILTPVREKQHAPGCYKVSLCALNTLAAGMYIAKMSTNTETKTIRIALIRAGAHTSCE